MRDTKSDFILKRKIHDETSLLLMEHHHQVQHKQQRHKTKDLMFIVVKTKTYLQGSSVVEELAVVSNQLPISYHMISEAFGKKTHKVPTMVRNIFKNHKKNRTNNHKTWSANKFYRTL